VIATSRWELKRPWCDQKPELRRSGIDGASCALEHVFKTFMNRLWTGPRPTPWPSTHPALPTIVVALPLSEAKVDFRRLKGRRGMPKLLAALRANDVRLAKLDKDQVAAKMTRNCRLVSTFHGTSVRLE